ncbi:MAG: Npun_R2821/Npun_R2822 family protein [Cyanophyceae cyanobacterium]
MSRGIYITANDKVTEQAIALLNSIRLYDPQTPIVLIPYNDHYENLARLLAKDYGVKVYADLEVIERLSQKLNDIFGQGFFARPINQLRKLACWLGEFDEFLYIDTDVVVFEKLVDNLNYLTDYDFLCCDYQYTGGIENVFTSKVIEEKLFTQDDLLDIFNSGFWASKKNAISEAELYESFAECAAHPEYFDFSQKTSDQPIINYLVLKRIKRRFNIVRRPGKAPGSWAGSDHFQRKDNILIDPKTNQPLQYLHWAGIRIYPGCPYWDIWKHYRYLHSSAPPDRELTTKPSRWQQIKEKLKSTLDFNN